jgi:hypothetical protein
MMSELACKCSSFFLLMFQSSAFVTSNLIEIRELYHTVFLSLSGLPPHEVQKAEIYMFTRFYDF